MIVICSHCGFENEIDEDDSIFYKMCKDELK